MGDTEGQEKATSCIKHPKQCHEAGLWTCLEKCKIMEELLSRDNGEN